MASSDKLWFELGVRDEASKTLEKILKKGEVLNALFDEISNKKIGDGSTFSSIVEAAFEKAAAKATKLQTVLVAIDNELKKLEGNHAVNLQMNDNTKPILDTIESRIMELTPKLKELGTAINEAMSIQSKDPNKGNLDTIEQLTTEYKRLEAQINNLYKTYNQLSERQTTSARQRKSASESASVFIQDMQNEQKVEEALQMNRHRLAMEQKRDDAEVAAAVAEVNRVLAENKEKQRAATEAARERARINKDLVSSYDRVAESTRKTGGVLDQLAIQMSSYFSLWGAERLLKSVITIGGEFEVQHIALQNILGDVQQANSLFEQMKDLAVESPFNFRQLATYGKQIAAFGVPYEEMYDTTKRLADLSAGLGVDMSRLILAYGQVRSAAVLRGQELRQFTEAGIPMVRALAEEFTRLNGKAVTTAEVFELISKRAVPFEMVKKVMWDMTNEGGRFYDMQFVLADTLTGKWSNLRDAWEILLSDIAKGESLSGKFLKGMVQGLTDLIKGMNTLTPLIAGVGSFVALKSTLKGINSAYTLGTSGMDRQIQKAQQLHALELRRKYLNAEITKEKYKELMATNSSQARYYVLLGAEGRLKNYQVARLIQQKKITTEKLHELVTSNQLTMREAAMVRYWKIKNAQALTFRGIMGSIKTSVNGMMGPIGWITLALDAMLMTILTISGRVGEVNAKNKELAEGFANRAKELQDSIDSLQNASPTSDDELKSNIEGLKEILKQHAANYDAIILEANGLKTLREQYNFLKAQLNETQKVYKEAEASAPDFADATRKSFDNASSAAKKYFKALKENKISMSGGAYSDIAINDLNRNLNKIAQQILEDMPNIGKDAHANAVFRQMRDSLLQELGVGSRESMMIKIKLNELLNITDAEDAASLVVTEFGNMIATAAPEIANKIKYGRQLQDAEQKKVHDLIQDAANNVGKEYPFLANYLQKLLNDSNFTATIQLRFATSGSTSDVESLVYGRFPGMMSESVKNTATNWVKNANGNLYEARNRAKNDIDAAYNNKIATHQVMDAIISNSKASVEDIKKAKAANKKADDAYFELTQSALYGLNYDYEGEKKKSNKPQKTPKGSQKDTLLEEAKTRLEEIKDFYAEYKKYRDQYGEKKGLNMVEAIFGIGHERAENIVTNYKDVLKEILEGVPQDTEARKKFALGLRKLLADIDLDAAKNELQKALREMERYIQNETSKWNLYKNLLDKTGSKEFAMQAFVDGVEWDDLTRNMAERLKEGLANRKLSFSESLFDMDSEEAEKFLGKDTEELKLWDEIVKTIRKNWTDGLNDIAAASEKLMTIEDKILKTEQELAEMRSKYGKDDPRVIAKERELGQQQVEAFEQGEPYLRFYSSIFAMTAEEAEKAGAQIKANLVDQLAKGDINADKFLKSMKNVNQQLEKMRSVKSDALTLMTGGYRGLLEKRTNLYESQAADAALKLQNAEEALTKARLEGNEMAQLKAKIDKAIAKKELDDAQAKLGWTVKSLEQANNVLSVMEMISSAIDGMRDAAQQLSDMFDALGHQHTANTWSDIADTIGAIGSPVTAATNAMKSAMSGDVGGVISNAVGMFTSPITAFAKLHDKKLQRQIEDSEAKVKSLTTAYSNLQKAMESALGGIYTTGGYDDMLSNLKKQRDELAKQYSAESGKKKSDADKLADYEQQIKQMDEDIKNFALDMAKALYEIDLHSWASTLTDAVVSAWENGEDAAEAYRDKVKDIMKDLTKNILAKKVMEKAFEALGIDEIIASMMDASSGKLDEKAIPKLADALSQAGNLTVDAITKTLDDMEEKGYIDREKSSGSKSTSASIKSITEETADLLASYINAIRADVSVNRMTLTEMLMVMQGQSDMPVIAQAQLQQLQLIATNTARTADNTAAIGEIYAILHANILGANYFNMK